jgi:hypothetical protein
MLPGGDSIGIQAITRSSKLQTHLAHQFKFQQFLRDLMNAFHIPTKTPHTDTTSEGTPRLLEACNFLKALIQSKPPAPQDINSMSYVIMAVNMQLGVPSDSQSEKLVTVDTEETCRILGTSPRLSDFPERLLLIPLFISLSPFLEIYRYL